MLRAIQAGNITEIRYYNFQPQWALLYSGSLPNFIHAYDLIEMGFMMVKFGMLSCYSRCCVVLYKLISGIRKIMFSCQTSPVHLFTLARQVSSNYGASCKLPYPWMVFPHHVFTNIPLLVYIWYYIAKKKILLNATNNAIFIWYYTAPQKLTEKIKKCHKQYHYWKCIKVTHESWWHIGKYWMFAVYHLSLKIMITLLTFLDWNQAWRGLLIQSNYWHYSFKRAFHKKNHQTNRLIQDLCI